MTALYLFGPTLALVAVMLGLFAASHYRHNRKKP